MSTTYTDRLSGSGGTTFAGDDGLIVTGTRTVNIPTDYANLQDALDGEGVHGSTPLGLTVVNFETGHTPATGATVEGDFSRFEITSDDATVTVDGAFPDSSTFLTVKNGHAPKWSIMLDMDDKGSNGIFCENADIVVSHRCGVTQAGANDTSVDSYGSGLVLLGTSQMYCDPISQDVVTRTGHTGGGTKVTFPLAASDQQADGYWTGHTITVTGGADSTAARVLDYDNATNTVTIGIYAENGTTLKVGTAWSAANTGTVDYTLSLLRGAVFTDNARRGITATFSSAISAVAADLRDNGTDAADVGHCAVFVSRASGGQLDRSIMDGSVRGVRIGRGDNRFSIVDSYANDIPGTVISVSEGSGASCKGTVMLRSGRKTPTALSVLFAASSDGIGGGSDIHAASCAFDGANGLIADCQDGGQIDISNSSAKSINAALFNVVSGKVIANQVSGSLASGAAIGYVGQVGVLASAQFTGSDFDANSEADYILRLAGSGSADVRLSTFSNAADKPFNIVDAARLYVEDNTIDASTFYTEGFWLEPGASLPARQDAVDAIEHGWTQNDVETFTAGGLLYKWESGSTSIPDMQNTVPAGESVPEHFGCVGDGATDDTSAFIAWAAYGGLCGSPAKDYRLTTLGGTVGRCPFPNAVSMTFRGRVILPYTDTSDAYQFDFQGDDSTIKGFSVYCTDNGGSAHYQERCIRLSGARIKFDDHAGAAETEQPDTTDATQDRWLTVTGSDCRVHRPHFENIYALIRLVGARGSVIGGTALNYGQGITIDPLATDANIGDCDLLTINSNATADPGHNAVTGGANGLRVFRVKGAAEEEFIYLSGANTVPIEDVSVIDTFCAASGQGNYKFKNIKRLTIENLKGQDAATGNAVGVPDNFALFEACFDVRGGNLVARANAKANPGYTILKFDSTAKVDLDGVTCDRPGDACIEITDARFGNAAFVPGAGYIPSNIVVKNFSCTDLDTKPVVKFALASTGTGAGTEGNSAGDLGNGTDTVALLINGLECYGTTGDGMTGTIAGTINGLAIVRGEIATSGTTNNVTGGGGIALNPAYST